jgi:hypothetical protein
MLSGVPRYKHIQGLVFVVERENSGLTRTRGPTIDPVSVSARDPREMPAGGWEPFGTAQPVFALRPPLLQFTTKR